ncbi:SH3 domain-containing protein [Ancylobacter sp. VNQ12]|uniref:SH3 domain-containing protein n=1 Tax=Ancylobacter sp. VNQ12 TaxID=3400920 RepID=UPI003BFEA571
MAGNSTPRLGMVIFGLLALAYCSSRESPRVASVTMPAAPRASAPLAAVPPPPALSDPLPAWSAVMFTTARVNLRAAPSTSAQVLLRLEAGASVTVSGSEGRWWRAAVGGQRGWVHADYLTASAPPTAAPPREPSSNAVAPAASLATPRTMGRRPLREAYVGICD